MPARALADTKADYKKERPTFALSDFCGRTHTNPPFSLSPPPSLWSVLIISFGFTWQLEGKMRKKLSGLDGIQV